MNMRCASSVVFLSLVFMPHLAAALVITEVMYDLEGSDSGREWIEVLNEGTEAVHLDEWRLFENGSNHELKEHSGGLELQAGAYAVIADSAEKFLVDWPSYSGALLDSAFSLSNTGEPLSLHCCAPDFVPRDNLTYAPAIGAAGDGRSLQLAASGSWIAAQPTPGAANSASESPASNPETVPTPAAQAATGGGGSAPPPPPPSLYADAGGDRTATVGAPVFFEGSAYDAKKKDVENVGYTWSFGDGSAEEGKSVKHVFAYPGRYVVVLAVERYGKRAVDQAIVTVVEPVLSLALHDDGSLSIVNEASHDAELSQWTIETYPYVFGLPERTIVAAKQRMRLSEKVMRFRAMPQTVLRNPEGAFVASVAGVSATGAGPGARSEVREEAVRTSVPVTAPPKAGRATSASIMAASDEDMPVETQEEMVADRSLQAAASGMPARGMSAAFPWLLGSIAMSLLGAGVAFISRPRESAWTIIEEEGKDV